VLVLVTLALTAFGLVMVYSATSARAADGNGQPMHYLTRQALFAGIGLVALILAARTPYAFWRRTAPTLVLVSLVMLAGALLVVAGLPGGLLARSFGIVAALGVLSIWFEPYRRARLFSFLDPWHDPQGAGFQIVQAMIGLGSGGWFGVGIGHGVVKIFDLP